MAASHPSPGKASDEQRGAPPAPVAAAPVVAATATASASAIALAEPASPTPAPRALAADGKGLATAKTKGADPAFDSARALYDSGHYAEALPKFEALAAHSAEAELYVARCLAQTTGCAAADPHFDSAARRSDAESASHARLEAARCYKNAGHATAARSRYNSLTGDRYVAQEANRELAEITPKASGRAGPGAPAATATAKPPMAKPAIKTDAY